MWQCCIVAWLGGEKMVWSLEKFNTYFELNTHHIIITAASNDKWEFRRNIVPDCDVMQNCKWLDDYLLARDPLPMAMCQCPGVYLGWLQISTATEEEVNLLDGISQLYLPRSPWPIKSVRKVFSKGRLTHPWYHSIYLALQTIIQTNNK